MIEGTLIIIIIIMTAIGKGQWKLYVCSDDRENLTDKVNVFNGYTHKIPKKKEEMGINKKLIIGSRRECWKEG